MNWMTSKNPFELPEVGCCCVVYRHIVQNTADALGDNKVQLETFHYSIINKSSDMMCTETIS